MGGVNSLVTKKIDRAINIREPESKKFDCDKKDCRKKAIARIDVFKK
jgi:hypothetical protein